VSANASDVNRKINIMVKIINLLALIRFSSLKLTRLVDGFGQRVCPTQARCDSPQVYPPFPYGIQLFKLSCSSLLCRLLVKILWRFMAADAKFKIFNAKKRPTA
jgi:hypothetical protein